MMKTLKSILAGVICIAFVSGCAQDGGFPFPGSDSGNADVQTVTAEDDLWEKSPEEIKEYLIDKYVCLGTYPQDKNRDQPIEWVLIDVDEDKQLYLLSRKVLEVKQYDSSGKDNVTWEASDLRAFLNGEFYENSFSDEEKSQIAETELVNDKNDHGLPGGANTKDKVFVPSVDEIFEHVPLDDFSEETGKGISSYLYTTTTDHVYYYRDSKKKSKDKTSPFIWEIFWLRLPKNEGNSISVVGMGSSCPVGNMYMDAEEFQGVRPAIKVRPSKLTLTENEYYDRWKKRYDERIREKKKKDAYEKSQLCFSSGEYLEKALKEIIPGKEVDFSLDLNLNIYEMDEDEWDVTIDSSDKALKYFYKGSDIYIDYESAGVAPEELMDELMKRGISGTMPCLSGRDSEGVLCEAWIFNASDGSIEIYRTPGY